MAHGDVLTRKHRMQARARFQNNQLEEAARLYEKVLARNRMDLEALQMLGTIADRQGKWQAAKGYFERGLKASARHHELWYQLGVVNEKLGERESACAHYEKSMQCKADFLEPVLALGNIRAHQGLLEEAKSLYLKVLSINAAHVIARNNLANVLANQGDSEAALEQWQQVLEKAPGYMAAQSNRLLALNYLPDWRNEDIFAAHRAWAQGAVQKLPRTRHSAVQPEPGKKIHVAYVSADFCQHSVAYFIESILKAHDRTAFRITCYSDVRRPDAVSERLQGYVDSFRSIVQQADEVVAQWIQQDQVDILVDLAGHTSGNRLPLFARKPAPVQLSYLGYPNTTGLEEMDYRITDAIADPVGEGEAFYTEKLLRLPGGFLCYRPPDDAPDVNALPAEKEGVITFGVFNNVAKITPQAIQVWAEILRTVEGSRILFKNRHFSDAGTCARYRTLLQAEGVAPERILFSGLTPAKEAYLETYHQVDMALDSFPYNGTTTTFDALWMGVPTITLSGDRHASRVGAAILARLDLDFLIAHSKEEYVRLARELSGDRGRLAHIRQQLRAMLEKSTLFDAHRIAREMEEQYRNIWEQWCATR